LHQGKEAGVMPWRVRRNGFRLVGRTSRYLSCLKKASLLKEKERLKGERVCATWRAGCIGKLFYAAGGVAAALQADACLANIRRRCILLDILVDETLAQTDWYDSMLFCYAYGGMHSAFGADKWHIAEWPARWDERHLVAPRGADNARISW
jgi:hypothetical protein